MIERVEKVWEENGTGLGREGIGNERKGWEVW